MSKDNFNRNLAIIIGINHYQNGIRELKTAAPDALKLAEILQKQHEKLKPQYQSQNKYEVQLFLNQRANLSRLKQLIADFQQGQIALDKEKVTVTDNDRLLFYFAGHGIALDALENQEGPVGYLIPQDAISGDSSTYLPMQELHDGLNALPCRHMLAILDCCFAGAFRWASLKREIVPKFKVYKERYDRFISDRAWQVITSAADDQKALDSLGTRGIVTDGNEEHSPFAKALFDALLGKRADLNQDGIITATEIYSHLRDQVEILTETQYQRQTPSLCPLRKHNKGEFIFLSPEFDRDKLEDAPALNEENNPYRGLSSYDEKDSNLFFGREEQIQKLYQKVVDNKQQVTLVLGASGTGKSSLVKAGLIPKLRNDKTWRILPPFRPGESPFQSLNQVLESVKQLSLPSSPEVTSSRLFTPAEESLGNWFKKNPQAKLLVVIDQFEELITLSKSEEAEKFQIFIKNSLAKYPNNIHVVITLRLDFEAQFQSSILKDFWNDDARFVVPPMSQSEFRQAIEKPASQKVVYFDPPSLVDELINEVVQMPGALPLLSFTLSELYLKYLGDRTRDNRALTKKDYEDLGRVVGSLTQRANQEYDRLVKENPAYQDTVRRVMLRMVSLQGGELARRQVPKSELVYPDHEENKRVQIMIQRFSEARLIVEGSNLQGEPYIEPAHDALVQGWDKLLTWKNQEQETLVVQRLLIIAANEWAIANKSHKNDQVTGYLWHDNPRLPILENLLISNNNWLNKLETEFIKNSMRKRDEEDIQKKTQIIRILYRAAEALSASNQQLEALVEAVKAGQELNKLQRKYSLWQDSELSAHVRRTLQNILYKVKERNRFLIPNGAYKIAFSPNGQLLAIVEEDHTISFWDRSGKHLSEMQSFNVGSQILSISFSPDSQHIITVITDEVVKWWNLTGQKLKQLKQPGIINQLMIGSTGKVMVFSYNDNIIQLRDLENGKPLAEFHAGIAYEKFSTDGKLIAHCATAGDTISIWEVESKRKIADLKKHFFNSNISVEICFSPDSKLIATAGSQDDTICLWDLKGNQLAQFRAYQGGIKDISFSPDGKQLATVGIDNTIRIWQDIEGKQITQFSLNRSPDNDFTNICMSSDCQLMATSNYQGIINLWDLNKGQQFQLPKEITDISKLHFSYNNHLLAVIEGNGTVHLFNVEDRQELTSFTVESANIDQFGSYVRQNYGHLLQGISFSADGNLAIGGDNYIHVCTPYGQELATFIEDSSHKEEGDIVQNWVQATAFDPSGNLLATGGIGGYVRLWNWRERKQILPTPIKANITQTIGIVFSPTGNILATTGLDGVISVVRLWNLSGDKLLEIKGHQGTVQQVIFSPNGSLIATVTTDFDSNVNIWNLSGQKLAEFQGINRIESIVFSPDSKQLMTAGFIDGSNDSPGLLRVDMWQIDLNDLLVQGYNWVQDYLKNNPNVEESDRQIILNINKNS